MKYNKAMSEPPKSIEPCPVCNFKLFNPIYIFDNSNLVLYNDSRFRGRCILSLKKHFDSWEEVNDDAMVAFIKESQQAVKAIKKTTGCTRVNVASLSNSVSHVHLHLIPRFPDEEEFPNSAPWRDRRIQKELPENVVSSLISDILGNILKNP